MDKRFGFSIIAIGCIALAGVTASHKLSKRASLFGHAENDQYEMVLGNGSAPASITSSYQNSVTGDVQTSLGHDVELSFVNAKTLSNGFVELAPHGKIYNFGSTNDQLTGINGISFTGSGSFTFKPAVTKGILADLSPISVSAGSSKVALPTCDYFEIEAGDSGASISTLTFAYSCDPSAYDLRMLDGTYTGTGTDGYRYKVTVTNGSVVVNSLDRTSNVQLTGTMTMNSKTSASLAFNEFDAVANFSYDGHGLTYTTKSGSEQNNFPNVSVKRVYNVEDFESYTATGQGYTNSTTKYQTTGLRSQFYADYYTSGTGEIGGSNWPVMTSSDNSNYSASLGHNSSKGGIFKFSNGMSMRYINMNSLYGVNRVIGKGSTISLWARGAYTNTSFNANHASNTAMKLYAYYETPLTSSNSTSARETFDFTVLAGSDWQHFEFSLTPDREYFGFGIYAQQSSGSTQYVPIDDIKIYTDSPYEPARVNGVSLNTNSLNLTAGNSATLVATVTPNDAANQAVTWNSSNTAVATVNSNGLVEALTAGSATITVTTADGGYTATCSVTVTGVAYPAGTFKATITGNQLGDALAVIASGQDGTVIVKIGTYDVGATGYTSYNPSTGAFTIATTGSVKVGNTNRAVGNITGTYNSGNNTLTGVGVSGALKSYISNNNSYTFSLPSYWWGCDENTSGLQNIFKRRYMSGSWQVDNGNSDRITQNTTQYVGGGSSVKLRGYGSGAVALNLKNDQAMSSVSNLSFWVYNPSASNVTVRLWIYAATNFGSNSEIVNGGVTATAGQWTFIRMGFSSQTIYNFQLADFTNSGTYLSFDNICVF